MRLVHVLLASLCACSLVRPSLAQTESPPDPGADESAKVTRIRWPYYGTAMAWIGDWNADGVTDFAVSEIAREEDPTFRGCVDIRCGGTGALLATLTATTDVVRYGILLSAAPDLDADGVPELVVASEREASECSLVLHWISSSSREVFRVSEPGALVPRGISRHGSGTMIVRRLAPAAPDGGAFDVVVLVRALGHDWSWSEAAYRPFGDAAGLLWRRSTPKSSAGAVATIDSPGGIAWLVASSRVRADGSHGLFLVDFSTGEVEREFALPPTVRGASSLLALRDADGLSTGLFVGRTRGPCARDHERDARDRGEPDRDHGIVHVYDGEFRDTGRSLCAIGLWQGQRGHIRLWRDAFRSSWFGQSLAHVELPPRAEGAGTRRCLVVGDGQMFTGSVWMIDVADDTLVSVVQGLDAVEGNDEPVYGFGYYVAGDEPSLGIRTGGRVLVSAWSPVGNASVSGVAIVDVLDPKRTVLIRR